MNYDQNQNLYDAIAQVESGGKNVGAVMDEGSYSVGPYQIKKDYYIDAGTPGKKSGGSVDDGWMHCAQDFKCSEQAMSTYWDRYGSKVTGTGQSKEEIFARNHNGGPNGYKSKRTVDYWNKVQREMKK